MTIYLLIENGPEDSASGVHSAYSTLDLAEAAKKARETAQFKKKPWLRNNYLIDPIKLDPTGGQEPLRAAGHGPDELGVLLDLADEVGRVGV